MISANKANLIALMSSKAALSKGVRLMASAITAIQGVENTFEMFHLYSPLPSPCSNNFEIFIMDIQICFMNPGEIPPAI
jgi:hypothetical protein